MPVPFVNVVNVELYHEVVRPILHIVILQAKDDIAESAVHRPAEAFGQLKTESRKKLFETSKSSAGVLTTSSFIVGGMALGKDLCLVN